MARKRIGQLLVERGVINIRQLEEGLELHRRLRIRLGAALVKKAFITEEELARALSVALSIPQVDLRATRPSAEAVQSVRSSFCETHELIPFALQSSRGRKQLLVAMSDPLNLAAIDELEFTTGAKVVPHLATHSAIHTAILRAYFQMSPEESQTREGKMLLVQRGGGIREVSTDTDDEVITGEELVGEPGPVSAPPRREVTARTALASLIEEREKKNRRKREVARATPTPATQGSASLLFSSSTEDQLEKLERKFWALMRIMARKGVITQEEFSREFDDE